MGSRKQKLKNYLGISEYPWSSDDDDDDVQQPSNQEPLQRAERDPRPSVADMPGTSSAQPPSEQVVSPATTRKIQDRMDRDLFWSIINNTSRSTDNIQSPRYTSSRVGDLPLSSIQRSASHSQPPSRPRIEVHIREERPSRRPDRPPPSEAVQRILAFKKLTRSLQNMSQHRASTSACPVANRPSSSSHISRVSRPHERQGSAAVVAPDPATSSSTTTTSSAPVSTRPMVPGGPQRLTSSLLSTLNNNRQEYNCRQPWRRSLLTYPTTNHVQPGSAWQYNTERTSHNLNVPSVGQSPTDFVHVLDHSEDEQQPVITTSVAEPHDETNDNAEEENGEGNAHIETGNGVSLIEEVVEVDTPDETDNNPPPPGTEGEEVTDPNPEISTNSGANNSAENAGTPQEDSSYHGVKRKRDSSDETNELFSVQDFNQSLLRLLECPVCLEWMEPPISQCRRGHLVCSRCRARLANCPVCRTPFSSVRNRAMEGVAELLRYPCRHGCGREVALRRRHAHEASCAARRHHCPAPACARHPPLPRDQLAHHFQCKHLQMLKIGCKHEFSIKVNSEQHDTWLIMALDEYFHLRVDVDMRVWGIIVYVAYIGPKKYCRSYTYEVTMKGQSYSSKLVYTRYTHSDLESALVDVNLSRQRCFHLIPDQAINFIRFKNRHCPDKYLDFDVEITKWDTNDNLRDDSES